MYEKPVRRSMMPIGVRREHAVGRMIVDALNDKLEEKRLLIGEKCGEGTS
jgi:hypothetical protein